MFNLKAKTLQNSFETFICTVIFLIKRKNGFVAKNICTGFFGIINGKIAYLIVLIYNAF